MLKIFLDDIRRSPPGFKRVYTAAQAIEFLKNQKVQTISLDHDLGTSPITGLDVVRFMVENHIYPGEIIIHSANPFGRYRMYKLLMEKKPSWVKVAISPLPWMN